MTEKKKIVFAPQNKIRELRPWVGQVLKVLGHPEAFVTDESCIGDFAEHSMNDRGIWLSQISEALGVPVQCKDYIVDVAQRIRES